MKKYLGIDIGGTKIKYGLFDEVGNEISNHIVDSHADDRDAFLNILKIIVEEHKSIEGIGISVPGIMDSNTGIISNANKIPAVQGLNLKLEIEKLTKVRVEIENDANCVALGEAWTGNGKGIEDFVCITIGTAIGGSIIINNQLLKGKDNLAGEFGYMIINNPFDAPNTSDYGNLASTRKLVDMIAEELNLNPKKIDGHYVFNKLNNDDSNLSEVYSKWLRYLAIGIRNINFILNPQKILIGGGISSQPKLIEDLREEVNKIMPIEKERVIIQECKNFNNSGKIGAIYNLISKSKY